MRMVKPQGGLMQAHTLYSRDAPRGPKSDRGTSNPRPHFLHCGRSMPCASCEKRFVLLARFSSMPGKGHVIQGEFSETDCNTALAGRVRTVRAALPRTAVSRPY